MHRVPRARLITLPVSFVLRLLTYPPIQFSGVARNGRAACDDLKKCRDDDDDASPSALLLSPSNMIAVFTTKIVRHADGYISIYFPKHSPRSLDVIVPPMLSTDAVLSSGYKRRACSLREASIRINVTNSGDKLAV